MSERESLFQDAARRVRATLCDTYYRLLPTQAGKNRGVAYRVLRQQTWDALCHFCGGQARPFHVPDALWPAVLGNEQACFNCFYDALGTHDVLEVRYG